MAALGRQSAHAALHLRMHSRCICSPPTPGVHADQAPACMACMACAGIALSAVLMLTGLQWLSLKPRVVPAVDLEADQARQDSTPR